MDDQFEAWIHQSGHGDDFQIDVSELLMLQAMNEHTEEEEEQIQPEEDEEGQMDESELLLLEQLTQNLDDDDDSEVWYYSESDGEDDAAEEETLGGEEGETNMNTETETGTNNKKNLPNKERFQLVVDLLTAADSELKLPRGMLKATCLKYGVHRSTVNRIWKEAKQQKQQGLEVNVASKKGNCGRKCKFTNEEALREVPLKQRTTIRSFAHALEVSPSTVYRLLKRGILRFHTNSIKPKLKPRHKVERLKFVLKQIIPANVNELPRFECLYNMIHIDEKCFFMSRITQRFYLLSEETEPYRACQSKNFITKVMFLAGQARPMETDHGDTLFDGKIGIFPFVDEVEAQKSSINRPVGTIELKAKQSITKDVIRDMIINQLIPAIIAKWPLFGCKTIWIQQDNARPHILPNDTEFLQASRQNGFDIHIICQPAQSPDVNILDLGFFRAIQAIQHQTFLETVEELVKSVNHTWLHLMYVMVEILKVEGGNNYKNPHKGKKRLAKLGQLPTVVEVPQQLVTDTVKLLNQNVIEGADTLMEDLMLDSQIE